MLLKLWISTQLFLERFWSDGRGCENMSQALGVFEEEVDEFKEALISGTLEESCTEAADVLVTICQAILKKGGDYWHLENALRQVIEKNDAKNSETHYINERGKITRIK